MNSLHTETLTPELKMLFPKLAPFKDDFYLAGGTALALQIGHRVSVDFDLFSDTPIKKTLLGVVEEVFGVGASEVFVNKSTELTLKIAGVKCTFLEYPFPRLLPLIPGGSVDLLSPKEILVTKAYTIGRRGSFKDYVDLYIGIRENISQIEEIIALARQKYGDVFNDRLFLEQLVFVDDLDEVPLQMKNGPVPTKHELVNFFSMEIQKIKL
ncbi:MAG: nucleotidyl transferase AbiEii/AbiGii toxin family protein [bacterium]|nr:nucleotidyl transferase AbiEii/AbiGii toxin family protein [bacterium]